MNTRTTLARIRRTPWTEQHDARAIGELRGIEPVNGEA